MPVGFNPRAFASADRRVRKSVERGTGAGARVVRPNMLSAIARARSPVRSLAARGRPRAAGWRDAPAAAGARPPLQPARACMLLLLFPARAAASGAGALYARWGLCAALDTAWLRSRRNLEVVYLVLEECGSLITEKPY